MRSSAAIISALDAHLGATGNRAENKARLALRIVVVARAKLRARLAHARHRQRARHRRREGRGGGHKGKEAQEALHRSEVLARFSGAEPTSRILRAVPARLLSGQA